MTDQDVIAAIDLAIDNVLRQQYPSCAEREAAIRRAMHELHLD